MALDDSPQTRSNLLAALLKSPAAIGVMQSHADQLISLDLSPDGRTLALLDDSGTLTFVDPQTRHQVGQPYNALGPELLPGSDDVRFSPDGTRVAVGGNAPAVVDARTHRLLAGLRIATDRYVSALRFSPDGRTLFAVVGFTDPHHVPGAGVQRFDARTGRALGPERSVARRPVYVELMVAGDGRRVVTTSPEDGTTIFDARTLRLLKRLPGHAERAALSPNDRTMVVGGRDGSVRFLDLATGNIRIASGHHTGAVVRAAFSADGRTAITGGEDSRVIVWNVGRAAAHETLEGHTAPVTASGDQSRRPDALQRRPGRQGHRLGSRRRPPPRPPIRDRTGQPIWLPALRHALRRPRHRRRTSATGPSP